MDKKAIMQCKGDSESSVDTCCNMFKLLDNDRLLSAHDDFLLRVFNLRTGQFFALCGGRDYMPSIHRSQFCLFGFVLLGAKRHSFHSSLITLTALF